MTWLHRVRLRVLAIVLAGGLAVFGLLSWLALPALPVVGVALLTVAAMVNGVTNRLSVPTCWSCGENLADRPSGVHGTLCDGCGAVNQHGSRRA